ncbi:hypothetical protein [Phytohabitans kaempferiae]|uniref:Uncharacterized protein n=1 Tax=Phytohabitans kaempferiae TaxID=1620943 RepID=A0ABV6MCL0_9ACTN
MTVLASHTSHARSLAMATVAAVLAPHAGLFVDLNVDPQAARRSAPQAPNPTLIANRSGGCGGYR